MAPNSAPPIPTAAWRSSPSPLSASPAASRRPAPKQGPPQSHCRLQPGIDRSDRSRDPYPETRNRPDSAQRQQTLLRDWSHAARNMSSRSLQASIVARLAHRRESLSVPSQRTAAPWVSLRRNQTTLPYRTRLRRRPNSNRSHRSSDLCQQTRSPPRLTQSFRRAPPHCRNG